jgi:hypothetical protein
MDQPTTPGTLYRYWAFISYSHADRPSARWLHQALEGLRIPRRLRAGAPTGLKPDRLAPIFVDDAELPAGHSLATAIQSALDVSRFLIVVASPAAARSAHVAAEIDYFIGRHTRERVLTVVVGGRPNAAARGFPAEQECFPHGLRHATSTLGPIPVSDMPFAADARGGRTQRAQAVRRIAAGMLGIGYEALHRRHVRRVIGRMATLTAVMLSGVALLLVPYGQLMHVGIRALGAVSEVLPDRVRGESARWIGTWVGSISSTCGNYSGPLTDIISVAGPGLLRLTYNAGGIMKGGYSLRYSGAKAISSGIPGTAYFSLTGNVMTIDYGYTCQRATLARQPPR